MWDGQASRCVGAMILPLSPFALLLPAADLPVDMIPVLCSDSAMSVVNIGFHSSTRPLVHSSTRHSSCIEPGNTNRPDAPRSCGRSYNDGRATRGCARRPVLRRDRQTYRPTCVNPLVHSQSCRRCSPPAFPSITHSLALPTTAPRGVPGSRAYAFKEVPFVGMRSSRPRFLVTCDCSHTSRVGEGPAVNLILSNIRSQKPCMR